MPSSHLILCRPLLLLPPIPPSIRVFSNESTLCIRWPKYWSFSFSISPSNEHPGLISFGMDWLDLLAVQGTLKSLLRRSKCHSGVPKEEGTPYKGFRQRTVFLGCSVLVCFLLSRVQLLATPWTVAHQAPLPWNSPVKNTGVGCHFLLQAIFRTQG